MRFKLPKNKNEDIFKINPELGADPDFSSLTERQMKFIILFADPESPYAVYPDRKRRQLAALNAGWKTRSDQHEYLDFRGDEIVAGKVASVERCIEKYRDVIEIDKREDGEMIQMVQQQIDNIKKVMNSPTDDVDELKKRNGLIQSLPELRRTLKELQQVSGSIIAIEDEEENEKGLSTIDRVAQENGL